MTKPSRLHEASRVFFTMILPAIPRRCYLVAFAWLFFVGSTFAQTIYYHDYPDDLESDYITASGALQGSSAQPAGWIYSSAQVGSWRSTGQASLRLQADVLFPGLKVENLSNFKYAVLLPNWFNNISFTIYTHSSVSFRLSGRPTGSGSWQGVNMADLDFTPSDFDAVSRTWQAIQATERYKDLAISHIIFSLPDSGTNLAHLALTSEGEEKVVVFSSSLSGENLVVPEAGSGLLLLGGGAVLLLLRQRRGGANRRLRTRSFRL